MLEIKNIDVFYGDVQVIWDISFEVKQGEIVALIGANGAGKSTTLKTISGILRPKKGEILFNGITINRPDEINKAAHPQRPSLAPKQYKYAHDGGGCAQRVHTPSILYGGAEEPFP